MNFAASFTVILWSSFEAGANKTCHLRPKFARFSPHVTRGGRYTGMTPNLEHEGRYFPQSQSLFEKPEVAFAYGGKLCDLIRRVGQNHSSKTQLPGPYLSPTHLSIPDVALRLKWFHGLPSHPLHYIRGWDSTCLT